jgi:hypothetical protein
MKLSELLGSEVVDSSGRHLGLVHDVQLRWLTEGDVRRFRVTGLICGGPGAISRAAHAWGYAEGRAEGPWLLRALTAKHSREAKLLPAESVVDWGPSKVRISGDGTALKTLADQAQQ